MIRGIGIDIVDNERFRLSIRRWGDRFLRRIFTEKEILLCRDKSDAGAAYAARFAVKEAILKAIGTGWTGSIRWRDMEILNETTGKPVVRVSGRVGELVDGARLFISMSHERGMSAGMAVIEEPGQSGES